MKRLYISHLAAIVLIMWQPLGNCVQTQSGQQMQQTGTVISGVVISVSGSRMEIKLPDGRTQAVTAQRAISPDMVGKKISGRVVEAGDTNLIIGPSFGN
jgi:hypothetical protein